MSYHNPSSGARAIHLTNGGYVLVEPGATVDIHPDKVRRLAPDLVKADTVPNPPKSLKAKAAKVGKAKADKAPTLTDLRKAYKAKLGKNPSPAWDAATLEAKIAAA